MNVTDRVENILKYAPKTRDSDTELIITYMQKAGMELSPKQIEVFKSLPKMETIRRIRQKFQEEGQYLASPEVDKARFKKFKEVRTNIQHLSAEELLESQGKRVVWDE